MNDLTKEIKELERKAKDYDRMKSEFEDGIKKMVYAFEQFNDRINEISIFKLGKLSSLPSLRIGGVSRGKRSTSNDTQKLIFQTIRDAGDEGITIQRITDKLKLSYSGIHKGLSSLKNMRIGISSRTMPGQGRELKYSYDKNTKITGELPEFIKDIIAKARTEKIKHEEKGVGIVDEETGKVVEE